LIQYGNNEYRDDRNALDTICSAVPAEMIPMLAVKESAAEAWQAIKTFRIGDEPGGWCRRRPSAWSTRTSSSVMRSHGDLGDAERDENAVRKYLRVIQGRYKHRVVSWRLSLISPRCPLRRSPAH
jgi:hypothetical protein